MDAAHPSNKYKNLKTTPFITKALPVAGGRPSQLTRGQNGGAKNLPGVSLFSRGVKSISKQELGGKKYKVKRSTCPGKFFNLGMALPAVSVGLSSTTGLSQGKRALKGFEIEGAKNIMKNYTKKREKELEDNPEFIGKEVIPENTFFKQYEKKRNS